MEIYEFQNRLSLIRDFTQKMSRETIPHGIQKIMIKIYADTLKINLTERMIDNVIEDSHHIYM
jgi:hypothetical protein